MKTTLKEILREHKENYSLYLAFSEKMRGLLIDVLKESGIPFLTVESRVKTEGSVKNKLSNQLREVESILDVQDLIGIRIISYTHTDVTAIANLIGQHFVCDDFDHQDNLGTDKVGYKSTHLQIKFPENRLELIEYSKFRALSAELQIRTVLQHGWAQNSHNQLYKTTAVLPEKIKRDFTLLSGLLEIADNEFDRIAKEIERYKNEIGEEVSSGKLDITIDSITIREFFDSNFDSKYIQKKFGPRDDMAEEIITELNNFGIFTLNQLSGIIKKAEKEKIFKSLSRHKHHTNYCGIARDLMLLNDSTKYFDRAWKKSWVSMSEESLQTLKEVGLNKKALEEIRNKISE